MDYSKYENKLDYPKMIKIQCPNCGYAFLERDKYCCDCGQEVRSYYNKCLDIYSEAKRKYNEEEVRLYDLFKHDALDDVGLLDHPKADKIFYFAWDHGHSSGYSEVYYWLLEVSELFEED